jgi:hypothetical protein
MKMKKLNRIVQSTYRQNGVVFRMKNWVSFFFLSLFAKECFSNRLVLLFSDCLLLDSDSNGGVKFALDELRILNVVETFQTLALFSKREILIERCLQFAQPPKSTFGNDNMIAQSLFGNDQEELDLINSRLITICDMVSALSSIRRKLRCKYVTLQRYKRDETRCLSVSDISSVETLLSSSLRKIYLCNPTSVPRKESLLRLSNTINPRNWPASFDKMIILAYNQFRHMRFADFHSKLMSGTFVALSFSAPVVTTLRLSSLENTLASFKNRFKNFLIFVFLPDSCHPEISNIFSKFRNSSLVIHFSNDTMITSSSVFTSNVSAAFLTIQAIKEAGAHRQRINGRSSRIHPDSLLDAKLSSKLLITQLDFSYWQLVLSLSANYFISLDSLSASTGFKDYFEFLEETDLSRRERNFSFCSKYLQASVQSSDVKGFPPLCANKYQVRVSHNLNFSEELVIHSRIADTVGYHNGIQSYPSFSQIDPVKDASMFTPILLVYLRILLSRKFKQQIFAAVLSLLILLILVRKFALKSFEVKKTDRRND